MILAIAAFFSFRYFQLAGIVYPIYAAVCVALGLASLAKRLPVQWQNMTLNLGISLIFLDFVFAEIDLGKVGKALVTANYWLLIPSTLLLFAHLYFRTLRWQWLLKPMGEVSFWPAFRALVIGITGNAVLPARAGEFLRAYVLGRSSGLSKTGVFATLVVERVFDGLTVLLVLVAVIILGVRNQLLQTAGILAGIFYIGVVVALVLFMIKRDWADTVIKKLLPQNLAHFTLGLLDGFSSGLAILRNPRQLAMVTLWNLFTWLMIPISFWVVLLAFDFGAPVPWQAPVLMLPAMALGLTIPGAPAGVGLVQAAVKLTLDVTFANLPVAANFKESVAAASILIHFSQFAPEVVPGIFSFVIEGLSTKDIGAGQRLTNTEVVNAR